MLKKILLLGTDLEISRIALGTMLYGATITEDTAFQLLDMYREQGGNILDTALIYNDWLPGKKGRSEKSIGRWIKARGAREEVYISTKGAHPRLDNMSIPRLSKEDIEADLDASLSNLQVERIDLYWLHRDDPQRKMAEILDTLEALVRAGKIRYYGCSNFQPSRIREAMELARAGKARGFVANQLQWSMAVPNREAFPDQSLVMMDSENYRFHQETALPAFTFSSQAGGYFPILEKGGEPSAELSLKYSNTRTDQLLMIGRKLADRYGTDIVGISLAYLIGMRAFPTVALVGSHTPDLLRSSLAADTVQLEEDDIRAMDAVYFELGTKDHMSA